MDISLLDLFKKKTSVTLASMLSFNQSIVQLLLNKFIVVRLFKDLKASESKSLS